MMSLRLVSFAALVLGVATARVGASTTAEAHAKAWLRMHQDPDRQGLEDLKNSDPNSYAIVQALLMKQQAGLIDASNPTGRRPEAEAQQESAADIMRDAPTIEGAPPISEVAIRAPVKRAEYHGDPWHFKAHSAEDDDALVQGVLGAAAELVPSGPSAPASSLISSKRSTGGMKITRISPLSADMGLVSSAGGDSDAEPAPTSQQSQSKFYGISMNWGKSTPEAPTASMSQQNSYVEPAAPVAALANPYLDGIDLGRPAVTKPEASMLSTQSSSDLASFNWGDLSDVASGMVKMRPAEQPRVEAQFVQRVEDKLEQSKLKGALADFLAPPQQPAMKPPAPQQRVQKQDEQPGEKIDPMAMDNYNNWARGFH